jgi:hypothetical protein
VQCDIAAGRRDAMKGSFRSLILALLCAAVMAGCGGGGVDATSAPPVPGGGDGEIKTAAPALDEGGGVPAGDFVNGDFEQGSGVGWIEEPAGLIVPASDFGVTAVSGTYVGWLGYAQDDRRVARLSQTVIVPDAPVALGFYSWLHSEESCDPPWWDTMGTYANGEPLLVNERVCNNDSQDGWTQLNSFDVSAYAGQTVTFSWEISSTYGDPLASMIILDDVQFLS